MKNGSQPTRPEIFRQLFRRMITLSVTFQIIFQTSLALAGNLSSPPTIGGSSSDSFMVQKEETSAKAGSVYVTPTKKNEVLFKASIWGAVQYPGVHYMPLGTRLLDALSLAGGPIERADMDQLILSSHEESGLKIQTLSVSKALANSQDNPLLRPEDVLVVKEDRSSEKLSLYLQLGTFLTSVVALGLLVNRH